LTEPRTQKATVTTYNIKELKERGRKRETKGERELEGKHFFSKFANNMICSFQFPNKNRKGGFNIKPHEQNNFYAK
jgi:hypothetical protein